MHWCSLLKQIGHQLFRGHGAQSWTSQTVDDRFDYMLCGQNFQNKCRTICDGILGGLKFCLQVYMMELFIYGVHGVQAMSWSACWTVSGCLVVVFTRQCVHFVWSCLSLLMNNLSIYQSVYILWPRCPSGSAVIIFGIRFRSVAQVFVCGMWHN